MMLENLLRFFNGLVLLPIFRVLRYILPDLFDEYDDLLRDHDVSSHPLVSPQTPRESGAEGAAAVRHIYQARPRPTASTSGLLGSQPLDTDSMLAEQAVAGPELSDSDAEAAQDSDISNGFVQRLGSPFRSVGSDLTNIDKSSGLARGSPGECWPRSIYVLRHGERQDMAQPDWASSALRPWDPPLSAFGARQAESRGLEFQCAGIQLAAVVTSPFMRCIQTACIFMRAAGLPAACLRVDARVGEWMSARNLNLAHASAGARAALEMDVQTSFWEALPEPGVRAAIALAWSPKAAEKAKIASLRLAGVHESQASARSRFQGAVSALSSEVKGSFLVVTHGDALGAVIEQALPHATVYQVETAGYVRLRQDHALSKASVAEASGVAWLDSA